MACIYIELSFSRLRNKAVLFTHDIVSCRQVLLARRVVGQNSDLIHWFPPLVHL